MLRRAFASSSTATLPALPTTRLLVRNAGRRAMAAWGCPAILSNLRLRWPRAPSAASLQATLFRLLARRLMRLMRMLNGRPDTSHARPVLGAFAPGLSSLAPFPFAPPRPLPPSPSSPSFAVALLPFSRMLFIICSRPQVSPRSTWLRHGLAPSPPPTALTRPRPTTAPRAPSCSWTPRASASTPAATTPWRPTTTAGCVHASPRPEPAARPSTSSEADRNL